MSLSGLLQVSRNALASYQMAIDVTGGNIANVSTPGYSRQRPVIRATGDVQGGATNTQMSVEVTKVERFFDSYLEVQIVDQQQKAGYSETESSSLGRIETIFNETKGAGLNDVMGRFWGAWDDLANNPGGQVERDALVSVSEELATRFNTMATDLGDIQQDANLTIKDTISEINKLTSNIADLNKAITERGNISGESNRLLDERSESLKSLSNLIDLNYVVDSNGSLNVFLPNGKQIVVGNLASELDFRDEHVVFKQLPTESMDQILSQGDKGKLAALLNVRDDSIPGYQDKLDDLAKEIITQVNKLHKEGYDGYQNTGNDFFIPAGSENIAKNMAVKNEIIDDANRIAASAVVSSGNGEIALNVSALKDQLLMNSDTATLGSYYGSMVGQIGRDVADANSNAEHQDTILTQLVSHRDSVSGVSVDEEMMNIIKYQMGYNAAGRLCQTVNELLDTLMNIVK
ncbi:MAG: flagellar hook-associated protein FlgK [Deltaproteobacteria bacterium]|nr:flagellar hook-associated protein FlgK [Deltaproteobacteria bacterium]